jgi:hypothetical protein
MTWLPRSPGSTLVLWLNQETVLDFILLFLPPCGPHLTPLATRFLERSLLVFSTPGGLTGNDLSRLFFTCTNTSQDATCTCNTAHLGRRRRVLVRTNCLSCEAETGCARRRLVVRGGDWSEGLPLVGNLLEKLPTSWDQDVLLVMVLTGVLSPPRLESWPSRCQWCQKTPPQE